MFSVYKPIIKITHTKVRINFTFQRTIICKNACMLICKCSCSFKKLYPVASDKTCVVIPKRSNKPKKEVRMIIR